MIRTLLMLAFVALYAPSSALSQEVIFSSPRQLPDANGATDTDLEVRFAKGTLKQEELCAKLKGKPNRVNSGCEPSISAKEAKKVWQRNDETSAWEALSLLDAKADVENSNLVKNIMDDVLGSVSIQNGMLSFGTKSPGETTGRLIYACGRQSGCLTRSFSPEDRAAVTKFLLTAEPFSSGIALGLKALSDVGMAAVTVTQAKNAQTATVSASNLLGKPLNWKLGKATASVVSQSGSSLKVTFDAKQGQLARVPVEIELETGVKATQQLLFDVQATFKNAKVIVKDRSTVKGEHSADAFPAKISRTIELNRGESLEASVAIVSGGAALCPEQVVFGFINKDGREYLAPGSCNEQDTRVVLPNNQKLAEELGFGSGLFDLVIIASDPRISNPTKWILAQVQLSLSPPPEKKHEPLFTHHLLYDSDSTLKALPEIHHQFRQPDRRAPIILAIAFSALQVGFLVALFANLVLLRFRPTALFSRAQVAFFTCTLALVEVVFAWYWIAPSGAPNMENLTYKYLPPLLAMLLLATRQGLTTGDSSSASSSKKSASM